jgi:hypothetical protein
MDVKRERLTNIVQRVFGSGATLGGCVGASRYPGVLTIAVDGEPWGSGRTLEEAMGAATCQASRIASNASGGRVA